jgi:hypothetical protein
MDEAIFICLVLFAVAIGVVRTFQVLKRTKSNWMFAARRLGLKYIPGTGFSPGVLKGDFKGDRVRVETFVTVSEDGESSKSRTMFHLRYASPHPDWFVLSSNREEVPAESRGEPSTRLGDQSFDGIVRTQCEDLDKMSSFLTRRKRRKLALAFLGNKHLVITNRGIRLTKDEATKDAGLLILQIKALSRLADMVLGRHHDDTDDVDGLPIRHKTKKRRSPKKRPRGTRGHGDPEESRGDESTAKTGTEKTAENASSRENGAAASAEVPAAEEFSLDDCVEELFSGIGSLEAERVFEEKYRGRHVELDGVLKSAAKFSYDLVFHDGPGVKATFFIKELKGRYSHTKIKAVARFPESKSRDLKSSIGKKLSFSGELIGVDTLLKTLVLGDAEIVGRSRRPD